MYPNYKVIGLKNSQVQGTQTLPETHSLKRDNRKLNDKQLFHPTIRMYLTNKEILEKALAYSQELREHYELYQLLLFHFQEKQANSFLLSY